MAINKTYEKLVESAKPKLTTDDCYTPDNIYSVVRDYVAERYGLDPGTFVRPFYPGGDYQAEDYTGKVVVDNPPFSILRKIMNFYNENGIKWFLFTPGMCTVIGTNYREKMHICLGAGITYENGATVRTSFATNLEPAGIRTDPALLNAINEANEENRQKTKKIKNMTSWNYPPQLLTAAKMNYLANYGIDISFSLDDLHRITKLDNQPKNKKIYGGGYLLNQAAADRLAEAEAEAEKRRRRGWNSVDGVTIELSDRERALVYGE